MGPRRDPAGAARRARRHHRAWLARFPDRRDAVAAAGQHRRAVHPGDRRHLRHPDRRHRPVDPGRRLAGQRHPGAIAALARPCRVSGGDRRRRGIRRDQRHRPCPACGCRHSWRRWRPAASLPAWRYGSPTAAPSPSRKAAALDTTLGQRDTHRHSRRRADGGRRRPRQLPGAALHALRHATAWRSAPASRQPGRPASMSTAPRSSPSPSPARWPQSPA